MCTFWALETSQLLQFINCTAKSEGCIKPFYFLIQYPVLVGFYHCSDYQFKDQAPRVSEDVSEWETSSMHWRTKDHVYSVCPCKNVYKVEPMYPLHFCFPVWWDAFSVYRNYTFGRWQGFSTTPSKFKVILWSKVGCSWDKGYHEGKCFGKWRRGVQCSNLVSRCRKGAKRMGGGGCKPTGAGSLAKFILVLLYPTSQSVTLKDKSTNLFCCAPKCCRLLIMCFIYSTAPPQPPMLEAVLCNWETLQNITIVL